MTAWRSVMGWFGLGGRSLEEKDGVQYAAPSSALVADSRNLGPDQALQISTVWACVSRRATTMASLPFFVYQNEGGRRTLDRTSRLWQLLHETPNRRMTPYEFWMAMMLNHDLRGNAYARIERDPRTGEAISLWPMPADQVQATVLDDGSMVYLYRVGYDVAALAEESVLHLKDLGNGTTGLPRLEYMQATSNEAQNAQWQANRVFGSSGKPTGVLMLDHVLKPDQRKALQDRFSEMASGNTGRLFLLEANMKYQQISLSPQDQQLLDTRRFTVEEICRWFDVPPVLVHHSNVTTWGSGIEQIVDGFHKFTIRPLAVSVEQAVRKRVMTAAQRSRMTAELSLDALLRSSLKDRMEIYSKAVQNGIYNRNECRQLENAEPYEGGEVFTAQMNLAPVDMLGELPEPKPAPVEAEPQQLSAPTVNVSVQEDPDTVARVAQMVGAGLAPAFDRLASVMTEEARLSRQTMSRLQMTMADTQSVTLAAIEAIPAPAEMVTVESKVIYDEKGRPIGTEVVKQRMN
jgi:HK97 family phage portal protein